MDQQGSEHCARIRSDVTWNAGQKPMTGNCLLHDDRNSQGIGNRELTQPIALPTVSATSAMNTKPTWCARQGCSPKTPSPPPCQQRRVLEAYLCLLQEIPLSSPQRTRASCLLASLRLPERIRAASSATAMLLCSWGSKPSCTAH